MGRGYINVRATGGAVASFPWGKALVGGMSLCYFLCARESLRQRKLGILMKKGWGMMDDGKALPCTTQGENPTMKTTFSKKPI